MSWALAPIRLLAPDQCAICARRKANEPCRYSCRAAAALAHPRKPRMVNRADRKLLPVRRVPKMPRLLHASRFSLCLPLEMERNR
jgi:hypothetical protein